GAHAPSRGAHRSPENFGFHRCPFAERSSRPPTRRGGRLNRARVGLGLPALGEPGPYHRGLRPHRGRHGHGDRETLSTDLGEAGYEIPPFHPRENGGGEGADSPAGGRPSRKRIES